MTGKNQQNDFMVQFYLIGRPFSVSKSLKTLRGPGWITGSDSLMKNDILW